MNKAVSISLQIVLMVFSKQVFAEEVGSYKDPYKFSEQYAPFLQNPIFLESDVGVHVMNVRTKEEVFAYQADNDFVPASVMKVLTSAVALKELGAEYKYLTEIRYTGEIKEDGILKGNVYVVGAGDPYMDGEGLWKLTRNMNMAGVKMIQGNIYFDDSIFGGASYIPGWDKEVDIANGPSYFPMRSSLSLNTNNIAIRVLPGKMIGTKAKIDLEYPFSLVEIDNQVLTSRNGARPWMSIERETIENEEGEVEKMIYHMKGRIPVSVTSPWVYYRSIREPHKFFQENFMIILEQHQIKHKGYVQFGPPPRVSQSLAYYQSDPLRSLIADMNKYSRNLTAEHLLLSIAAMSATPAKTSEGTDKIVEYLVSLGIPEHEVNLLNGSGLSREMILKPSHVSAVLIDMAENPTVGPEYLASLSVGGRDGTLRRRFQEEDAGLVRGKTGSVNGVYCLACFVVGGDGELYTFVFFANNLQRNTTFIRDLQDQMISVLLDLQ